MYKPLNYFMFLFWCSLQGPFISVCVCVCVCYLYAVEGSALLLVQQGVVVGQLHQLVELFVGIFLLQLLQDSNHLEGRREDG